jgi:hypothetical protein
MADFDIPNDTVPQNPTKRAYTKPTIAAMKTALDTYNSTSYTAARMLSMTENDLLYACRLHGLTVTGL